MNKKEMRSLSKQEEKHFKEMIKEIISNSAVVKKFITETYPRSWDDDLYPKKVGKAVDALCGLVECLEEELEECYVSPLDFDRVKFVMNIIENQLTEIDRVALMMSLKEKYGYV